MIIARIRQWGLMMSIAFHLSGCVNSNINSNSVNSAIDKNGQLLLSIRANKRYFYHSDYLRLENFLKTAGPEETIQWSKYSMTYTLTSQTIFLDEKARLCRRYQFRARSFLPFTSSVDRMETACRCMDGQWRAVN